MTQLDGAEDIEDDQLLSRSEKENRIRQNVNSTRFTQDQLIAQVQCVTEPPNCRFLLSIFLA